MTFSFIVNYGKTSNENLSYVKNTEDISLQGLVLSFTPQSVARYKTKKE